MYGVKNINQETPILVENLTENENAQEDSQETQDPPSTQDAPMTDTTEPSTEPNEPPENPSPQQMSLCYYLYALQSQRSENLFHAIYPSADDKKIFILVSPDNQREALTILHGLQEIVSTLFAPEALSAYIPMEDGRPPLIPGFPALTKRFKSYASSVIRLSGSNPQDR